MVQRPSVLIVDERDDTREVLKAVLECRGLDILEARRADQGLSLARSAKPDLIVVDLEVESIAPQSVADEFAEAGNAAQAPVVLLGPLKAAGGRQPTGGCLAKPYHYAALIHRIEGLLGAARRGGADSTC